MMIGWAELTERTAERIATMIGWVELTERTAEGIATMIGWPESGLFSIRYTGSGVSKFVDLARAPDVLLFSNLC